MRRALLPVTGEMCAKRRFMSGEIGEDVGGATLSPQVLLSDELGTQGYTLREENVRYDFFFNLFFK